MTDEEARGNIIFDDDYLCPTTTIVPDEWSFAFVSRKRVSKVELIDYGVWYVPEGFVVMAWHWVEGTGYNYPAVKALTGYDQVEQYIFGG